MSDGIVSLVSLPSLSALNHVLTFPKVSHYLQTTRTLFFISRLALELVAGEEALWLVD